MFTQLPLISVSQVVPAKITVYVCALMGLPATFVISKEHGPDHYPEALAPLCPSVYSVQNAEQQQKGDRINGCVEQTALLAAFQFTNLQLAAGK